VDDGWIASFGDSQLEDLVDQAILENLDLRAAVDRMDAAADAWARAAALLRPILDLSLGTIGWGAAPVDAAGSSAAWEAEVWVRLASGGSTGAPACRPIGADPEFGRQSLAARAAKNWFLATESRLLLDLALEAVDLSERTLALVKAEHRAGRATLREVDRASAELASAEEALRQAIAGDQQARRGLELLLGRPPGSGIEAHSQPPPPPPIPNGLPARLLERRPDLTAAAGCAASALGLDDADGAVRVPPIVLNRTPGPSPEASDLILDLGRGRMAPLLRSGDVGTAADGTDPRQSAALAAYGQAVLTALREVEGALANERFLAEREEFLQAVLSERQQALELARTRSEADGTGGSEVPRFETAVVGVRIALVDIRSQRMLQRVQLHLALGGSFDQTNGRRVISEAVGE